jgi:putative two-component system response regulator
MTVSQQAVSPDWRRQPAARASINSRILVVDDEEPNLMLMKLLLRRHGYTDVHCIQDARRSVESFEEITPDLVILDLHMPHISGLEVLEEIRERTRGRGYLPVLILTGDQDPEARHRALDSGANDFLTKPFDVTELRCRVRNLLDTRALHRHLAGENERLERIVQERTAELDASHSHLLDCLAYAADFRDDETREHTHRVGDIAAAVAAELGWTHAECETIRRAARLHDLGKIAVPDAILLKPGPLTPDEFALMETHTVVGATMLANGRTPQVRLAEQIARSHHERWDGCGYPDGLSEDAIPIGARIVAVADVFDALSHARSYRGAWPFDKVYEHLRAQSGRHFDPAIIDALIHLIEARHPAVSVGIGSSSPLVGLPPAGAWTDQPSGRIPPPHL